MEERVKMDTAREKLTELVVKTIIWQIGNEVRSKNAWPSDRTRGRRLLEEWHRMENQLFGREEEKEEGEGIGVNRDAIALVKETINQVSGLIGKLAERL